MRANRNICCRGVGTCLGWGDLGITPNSYNFDIVKEFIYLSTAINTNNDVSLEIKR